MGPRFLHVVHGWPPNDLDPPRRPFGGAEMVTRAFHQALLDLGVESHVLALGEDRDEPGVHFVAPPTQRRFSDSYQNPSVETEFEGLLREVSPTVVHFHHLAGLSDRLPELAARAGATTWMTHHDYWMFCSRGQLMNTRLERCPGPTPTRCAGCIRGQLALNPALASLSRRSLPLGRLPLVGPLRSLARDLLAGLSPRPEEQVAARTQALERAMSFMERFFLPSRSLRDGLVRLGLDPSRATVLENPLVQRVSPAPPPDGPFTFTYVGPLYPTKGPHRLVEAFGRLPPGCARLLLLGHATPCDHAPTYARRLSGAGISLEGPFSPGKLADVFARTDVLVIPSLWEETSSLLAREAGAAGVSVVASRRGGIPEANPEAHFFEPDLDGDLDAALHRALERGRGRVPPRPSPSPREQAEKLLLAVESGRRGRNRDKVL